MLLREKIVLISGANRGIGLAICKLFASEGATVYAGCRNVESFIQEDTIEKCKGEIRPIVLDVCDTDSIKQCIMQIKKDCGKIDVLVNNAGITIIERFDMMSDSSLEKVISVNLTGLLHLTQMAMRLLKKSESPNIINMSSVMASESDVGQTVYASTKAAVESMTRTWTKEYTPIGFRINAIAPGNVNTDMFNIISEEELSEAVSKIGLGRIAEPEEIAKVALFLASDLSSYITGEVIHVNGGLVM